MSNLFLVESVKHHKHLKRVMTEKQYLRYQLRYGRRVYSGKVVRLTKYEEQSLRRRAA